MTPPLYRIRDKVNKEYCDDLYHVTMKWEISYWYDFWEEEEYDNVWFCGTVKSCIPIIKKVIDWEHYIIERSTGMQDINWERMYEWDIVLYWAWLHNNTEHIVIYEDGIWKISIPWLSYAVEFKYLEVVWNIHN